jgi:hypothetical protein
MDDDVATRDEENTTPNPQPSGSGPLVIVPEIDFSKYDDSDLVEIRKGFGIGPVGGSR